MVKSCAVLFCTNRRTQKTDKSFHQFPLSKPKKLKEWVDAMARGDDWRPSVHSCICSDHFREEDFYMSHQNKKLLRSDAVPSQFYIPGSRKIRKSKVQVSSLTRGPVTSTRSGNVETHRDRACQTSQQSQVNKMIQTKERGISSTVSVKNDHSYSPASADEHLQKVQAQLKAAKEATRKKDLILKSLKHRHARCVSRLTKVKEELEVVKTHTDSWLLRNPSAFIRQIRTKHSREDNLNLLEHELLNQGMQQSHIKYTSSKMREFFLALHELCPGSYKFLKRFLTLPDIQTIKRWRLQEANALELSASSENALGIGTALDPAHTSILTDLPVTTSASSMVTPVTDTLTSSQSHSLTVINPNGDAPSGSNVSSWEPSVANASSQDHGNDLSEPVTFIVFDNLAPNNQSSVGPGPTDNTFSFMQTDTAFMDSGH